MNNFNFNDKNLSINGNLENLNNNNNNNNNNSNNNNTFASTSKLHDQPLNPTSVTESSIISSTSNYKGLNELLNNFIRNDLSNKNGESSNSSFSTTATNSSNIEDHQGPKKKKRRYAF